MGCSIVAESDIIHRSRRKLCNSTLSQTIDISLPGHDIFILLFFFMQVQILKKDFLRNEWHPFLFHLKTKR